ncbi:unnamed protein product [Rotaria sp. Silwood2]|nr:unnamed protein product [Rotaria sp. Silwood2]CAF2968000.1 unnamed protein product [Rotaria sp. Silwood2]CAF3913579.1 unnamed protein product [Rotaria sp. Silwood2]CAF3920494.1 unnamed protein product [Rotaria sp. Silwood2]
MADDESPLVRDILISAAIIHDVNDDSLPHIDFLDTDIRIDDEAVVFPFDLFSLNFKEDETIDETISADQLLSNSSFDLPEISSIQSSSPSVFIDWPQHIISSCSSSIDSNHYSSLSLSFSNPPEPIYHVRYLSEITNSPVDGNIVNTKKKTKKNVSGRYLKGTHGRHVTIDFPINLPDYFDFFIRVTRLTVSYQNISFIHPYPLLYSSPKKKSHSDVIIKDPSIYYKLNKGEICAHSKQFPNIILTRLKQCQLKQINTLRLFDNSDITYPFIGNNAKSKIATYQLKKSQLDFRLVIRYNQTGEFIDLNISCRSNPLLEEEGTECKKLSMPSSL